MGDRLADVESVGLCLVSQCRCLGDESRGGPTRGPLARTEAATETRQFARRKLLARLEEGASPAPLIPVPLPCVPRSARRPRRPGPPGVRPAVRHESAVDQQSVASGDDASRCRRRMPRRQGAPRRAIPQRSGGGGREVGHVLTSEATRLALRDGPLPASGWLAPSASALARLTTAASAPVDAGMAVCSMCGRSMKARGDRVAGACAGRPRDGQTPTDWARLRGSSRRPSESAISNACSSSVRSGRRSMSAYLPFLPTLPAG
jgi:hypothetical protein